jgi:hypothetical protein
MYDFNSHLSERLSVDQPMYNSLVARELFEMPGGYGILSKALKTDLSEFLWWQVNEPVWNKGIADCKVKYER